MAQLLLVEDDVLLGQAVKSALEQDGHAVALAHNAAQAQKLWQAVRFDLCLLDIRLPDGSGLDLCAGFRQARDTPVIFLTANDADEDVVRGFQMGGDDYVTKPFAPEVLRQRVLTVLRRTGSGAQIIRYQENWRLTWSGRPYADRGKPSTSPPPSGRCWKGWPAAVAGCSPERCCWSRFGTWKEAL